MKKNNRKGVTLAEICIVLAVVAIVSLSVASFATMAGGRGTSAATKLDAMGDLEIVEAVVESWILEAVRLEETIKIDPVNEKNSTISIDGGSDKISVRSNGWMEVSFPSDGNTEMLNYNLKSVVGLRFETKTDGTATLYYCTVAYEYRNGIVTKEQTYTFCVYPRVGEIVGLPTGTPTEPTEAPTETESTEPAEPLEPPTVESNQ